MKTPIHLVIGQEATSVGCCAALETPTSSTRAIARTANYLAKGGDLKAMLCEMHCRATAASDRAAARCTSSTSASAWPAPSAIVGGAVRSPPGGALPRR
jgi:pyruvate dehydrogenase E1 component alpha subunit